MWRKAKSFDPLALVFAVGVLGLTALVLVLLVPQKPGLIAFVVSMLFTMLLNIGNRLFGPGNKTNT